MDQIGDDLGVAGGLFGGSGSKRPSLTRRSLPSIMLNTVYVAPLCITESLNGKPQRYFILAVCSMEVTSFILRLLSKVAGEISGYIWIL